MKIKVPHDEAVTELLWCFAMGMTRDEAAKAMSYASKSCVEQLISRERRYAELKGRKSRL